MRFEQWWSENWHRFTGGGSLPSRSGVPIDKARETARLAFEAGRACIKPDGGHVVMRGKSIVCLRCKASEVVLPLAASQLEAVCEPFIEKHRWCANGR